MNFPFLKRRTRQQPKKENGISIQDAIVFAMSKDFDISDGAEFIDDGMRMKDQPLKKSFYSESQSVKHYNPLQIQIQPEREAIRPIFDNQDRRSSLVKMNNYATNNGGYTPPDPWRHLPATTPAATTHNSPEEVVRSLKQEGYTENFETQSMSLYSEDHEDIRFHPGDFTIDKTFRFNGNCGPQGNPIVYAITSKTGVRGTLTDLTGTCSLHSDMVSKVYGNK